MEENDDEQVLPAKATNEDIAKVLGDQESVEDEEGANDDVFVHLKSSSIISILVIVMITLVCILATGLLINTILRTHSITRTLSMYFGFKTNRTIDETILTFWEPKSISNKQPIETTTTTTIISSSSSSRPPQYILSTREKKAQIIFRNFILPALFLLSMLCGIFAFYMRRHHQYYPAWGARPRIPERYITLELRPPKTGAH
ncbi:unnamed protein product [Adineta ricciae]|uniref:Uncharacterized protein n=1 Tax=Adineta ricciae TaxID=249248 RepID=A0A814ZD05_ADIRI|nr:unnamed protein product [Adineta ricciae]CAF1241215.1 unnamed protein product [Adineta ricciae]